MGRIIGEHIILREYQKEDLAAIRNWVTDRTVATTLSDIFLFPHTLTQTENYLNEMLEAKSNSMQGFVIAKKETLEYIGQIDLLSIDWKNRSALLGIVLSKDAQNHGYDQEAIKLLQKFVFNKLNLYRLELCVLSNNPRGQRCYEKCGFKHEGVKMDAIYKDGQCIDIKLMAILKPEWIAMQKPSEIATN